MYGGQSILSDMEDFKKKKIPLKCPRQNKEPYYKKYILAALVSYDCGPGETKSHFFHSKH